MRSSALVCALAVACSDPYAATSAPADGGSPPIDSSIIQDATPPASDAGLDAGAGCGWTPFADDFERASLLGGWTQGPVFGGPTSVTLGSASSERGTSLRVELIGNDSGTSGRSNTLEHNLSAPSGSATPSCVMVSFALFVTSASGPDIGVAALDLGNDTGVTAWINSSKVYFVAQTTDGSAFEEIAGTSLTTGGWRSVTIVYRIGGALTFEVDGEVLAASSPKVQLGPPLRVRVGARFARQPSSGLYFIDDVSIR